MITGNTISGADIISVVEPNDEEPFSTITIGAAEKPLPLYYLDPFDNSAPSGLAPHIEIGTPTKVEPVERIGRVTNWSVDSKAKTSKKHFNEEYIQLELSCLKARRKKE